MPVVELARLFGISKATIHKHVRKYGHGWRRKIIISAEDVPKIIRMYVSGIRVMEIAKIYNYNNQNISRLLKKHGVKREKFRVRLGTCSRCGEKLTYENILGKKRFSAMCKNCINHRRREYNRLLKIDMIQHYGGKCQCSCGCDITIYDFLTIEHPDGGGKYNRADYLQGVKLYLFLKKHGYPKDGYTIMCYNCNCARGHLGYCPRERIKKTANYPKQNGTNP